MRVAIGWRSGKMIEIMRKRTWTEMDLLRGNSNEPFHIFQYFTYHLLPSEQWRISARAFLIAADSKRTF
jgi:hypothetical protein